MTALPSGVYTIKNDGTGQAIGTSADKFFGSLPIQSTDDDLVRPDIVFNIDLLGNGNYSIKVHGHPVVGINGKVVALISPVMQSEWRIVPRNIYPGTLPVYTIEQIELGPPIHIPGTLGQGWVLKAPEAGSDVVVSTLIFTGPPFYPPEQLWVFGDARGVN
ncbi:hypothetical protein H0H81_011424 [Sphagnurus paluster]|uniref:Uncharacterized protein n=1 Tax=Sphagnurus paluster TaxID=117069 RepID=A0A9P7GN35_9AGAR|nr:hypothetical protein H0H81_011424 [Sphagnurus paluster]